MAVIDGGDAGLCRVEHAACENTLQLTVMIFFIVCFIFIPLLIPLNETATSRDDSRACFSL